MKEMCRFIQAFVPDNIKQFPQSIKKGPNRLGMEYRVPNRILLQLARECPVNVHYRRVLGVLREGDSNG
jgi:hypothetical protein